MEYKHIQTGEIAPIEIDRGLVERVVNEAKADAALFVGEHGTALDPSATDWDATAWSLADARREALEHSPPVAEELWPVYQAALVAETELLMTQR